MSYQNFNDLQMNVIRWAEARRIIPNSTPQAQFIKAVSEIGELADGIAKNDRTLVKDSVGDVLVCLINMCALMDMDVVDCLNHSWNDIKNRTGTMNEQGVFVRDNVVK